EDGYCVFGSSPLCETRSPRGHGRSTHAGRPKLRITSALENDSTTTSTVCEAVSRGRPHENGFRGTGFMEDLPGLPDQSALTPANFTTLPHFSVSSAMSLPKSLGEPVSAMPPRSASRAFILGSATPASISLLSLSMISTGVLLGAPTPNQPLAS